MTHEYDGNGLRVWKTQSGNDEAYVFSGTLPLAEYSAGASAGSYSKEYVYLGSQLIATKASSSYTFLVRDHLSVRQLLADAAGTPTEEVHLSFGETWYGPTNDNKWQLTSYERYATSGDDYAQARRNQYAWGRFDSPDPIGGSLANPQSWNRYTYVQSDPINYVDPLGLYAAYVCSGTPEQYYECMQESFGVDDSVDVLPPSAPSGPGNGEDHGGGGGGKGKSPKSNPGSAQKQNCLNNYNNSTIGKTLKLFSLFNLATDFKGSWKEWFAYPGLKMTAASFVKNVSLAIGGTEFLSITGGTSTIITGAGAAAVQTTEAVLGPVTPFAIGGSTLVDVAANLQCNLDPTLPPEGISVGPK